MNKPVVGIELFAGCGGLSTGFLDAGLNVVAGFELDRRAVDAYDYNHSYRGSRAFVQDIAAASGEDLLAKAGVAKIDFLLGGPPCQPFSIAGKRLGEADERSDLMLEYARLVEELQPKVFMLENVPNLMSVGGGKILGEVVERMEAAGYAVSYEVVSAADFGVPQMRRRLIVLGVRGRKTPLRFPIPTHSPDDYRLVRHALADLPDAAEFGECGIHNHEPTMHSAPMLERLSALKPGQRERGSFHDRLHPDKLSYTIRAGSGNFSPLRPIHHKYDRVITVRESARIQGFSDLFVWPDRIPRLQQYRQVGNAVPPPMAAALAKSIASQLKWQLMPDELRGDATKRAPAMALTDQERIELRRRRTRGASLGGLPAECSDC